MFFFLFNSVKSSVRSMEVCKRPGQIYDANTSGIPASFAGVMPVTSSAGNLNIAFNNQLNAALQNQVTLHMFLLLLHTSLQCETNIA